MTLALMNNSKFLYSMSPLQSREIASRIKDVLTEYDGDIYTLPDDKYFRDTYKCINVSSPNLIEYIVRNDIKLADYYLNCLSIRNTKYHLNIPFNVSDTEFKRLLLKAIEEDKIEGLKVLAKMIDTLIFIELGSGGWIKLETFIENEFAGHLIHIKQNETLEYILNTKIN